MECDVKKELLDDFLHESKQENIHNSTIIDIDSHIISEDTKAKEIDKAADLENDNDICKKEDDGTEANKNQDNTSQDKKTGDKKRKRSRKFKLEINIDIGNVYDEEFDAFTNENNVFRKYRLRQKNKPCSDSDEIPNKRIKPCIDDNNSEANQCNQCKMSFDSKTGLLNHLRIHKAPQKFICSLCFTDFDNNLDLLQHKQVHESEKRSFICENCKVAFSNHCDYLVHETTHMYGLSYKCVECGMRYTRKDQFQTHIKTHFNKKTSCPVCFKDIKDSCFQSHINSHKYLKECVECGKMCKSSAYNYHMSTHTGVKLHQCLYCGKGFANSQQKIVHMRIHTDERPYECKVCNRWFRQTTDLKRHMDSHKTEKNVSCPQCDKKFYHEESLNMHMRVHLNRDLFTCNICGEKYPNMNGLRAHTKYKHFDDRPFKCEACNVSFKDKAKLKRHDSSRNHRNKLYGFMKKKNE